MSLRLAVLAASVVFATSACRRAQHADDAPFVAEAIGLSLPHHAGWMRDTTVRLEDVGKGGLLMRLTREEQVAGQPRIEVIIDPVPVKPVFLEDVLSRALRDMADYEQRGEIDIQTLDQKPFRIGPRRGFRVTHTYVMSKSENIGITQTSTLFVLDGRGIAVTAVGRTELYTPLADDIDSIMTGMQVALTQAPTTDKTLTKPVDLVPQDTTRAN